MNKMNKKMFLFLAMLWTLSPRASDVIEFGPADTLLEPISVEEDRVEKLKTQMADFDLRLTKLEQFVVKGMEEKTLPVNEKSEKSQEEIMLELSQANHQILKDHKNYFSKCVNKSLRSYNGEQVELYITINELGRVEHVGVALYPQDAKEVVSCFVSVIHQITFLNKVNAKLKFKEVFNLYAK